MITEHPTCPATILFSENVQGAIEVARQLIAEQGCQSLKQQDGVDYDKLFQDPEFPASQESLYRDGDISDEAMLLVGHRI